LSLLSAGGGGEVSSVAGGQDHSLDPVYYAALVSPGGWCKVSLFPPPAPQPPPVLSMIARPPVDGNALWSS